MSDAPSLDRDLYCLTCGYNLRGLAGDPVRCPECGAATPVSEATRQEHERRDLAWRRSRARVETGASLCAIAVGAGLFFLALFVALDEFWPIRKPPLVTCAVIWVVGALTYAWQCRTTSGWLRAFARHQVFGILAALGNLVLVLAALIVSGLVFVVIETPPCSILVMVGAVVAVVWLRPMRWFSRRATQALEPMIAADLLRHDVTR